MPERRFPFCHQSIDSGEYPRTAASTRSSVPMGSTRIT